MTLREPLPFAGPAARPGLTRRGVLRAGIGMAGAGGLIGAGTGAFAAVEAADDLVVTDYRLTPPGWPIGSPQAGPIVVSS